MKNKGQAKLQKLREKIAFLKQVPDSIYFNLDSGELFLPPKGIAKLRKGLEQKIGHYVMTYKRNIFKKDISPNKHLCAHLQGAKLNKKQKALLEEHEQKVRKYNVSFVVYQKPLLFTNPQRVLSLNC